MADEFATADPVELDEDEKEDAPALEEDEEEKAPKYSSGVLTSVDVSHFPFAELKQSQINALRDLVRKITQRDMPARREEIIRCWEARLFWHGYQHLMPRRGGGWNFAELGSGYGRGEDGCQSTYETNIYAAYGETIISALSRAFPTVRFKPTDPDNPADITAAKAAEKLKKSIEDANGGYILLEDIGRYLYTDGRCLLYTRSVQNGSEFGFDPDPEPVIPEDEESLAPEQENEGTEEADGAPRPLAGRTAKIQEVISVIGALESKLPIKSNKLCDCSYVQLTDEMDIPSAKAEFPEAQDKIRAGAGGPGGDDIDRLARINVRLGVEDHFVTSDSQAYDVTVQRTWLRPRALLEIEDETMRQELLDLFPDGCLIVFAGTTFCFARNESIDDHFSLIHAGPGDGMNRKALGRSMISVQKRYNDWEDLENDTFLRCVPSIWMDNETFNVEALRDQTNTPGAKRPFNRQAGVSITELVYEEPTIQVPAGLTDAKERLGGETAQLLTGAYPALAGSDAGAVGETASGLSQQRDQALGRIGLPWRRIKNAFAIAYRQAVVCAANNRSEDITISLPGKKGVSSDQTLVIELADLKGNIVCVPDSDESFPESWVQRQARYTALLADAQANPAVGKMLESPENMKTAMDASGLEELNNPDADSFDKQLAEFDLLFKQGPIPNPAIQELKEKMAQMTASGQQIAPEVTAAAEKQASSLPPLVSTVAIDIECDNHVAEAAACLRWINSEAGRKAKRGSEEERNGFANIRQHYLEHKAQVDAAAQKAAAMAAQAQQQKPVSTSISLKDLPPNEAAQLAAKAGLQVNPADFAAQAAAQPIAA